MNKNGFTLIELLAVIIVLSVIMVIVVPIVTDSIVDSKEKAYNTTVESVKTAAESYLNWSFDAITKDPGNPNPFISPGYITLTIAELIDSGFLEKDIKNPKTGDALSGSVKITKINDNKYDYEFIN